jgi:predicted PolB exonuclease-like 3'-5' exonuclease
MQNFNRTSLFAFDIETIPDTNAACNLLSLNPNDYSVQDLRQKLTDYHLEITKGTNDFPRQTFHQVVCVSFVIADIINDGGSETYQLKEIRTGGSESSTEEEMVRGFFAHLGKQKARLVSFNGKTFDFPVLKYRALKYGIPVSWFYQDGDKWNNYGSKYSLDWHCDLIDALSDFGSSARIKLKEVCSILNIPCKYDIDGGSVAQLYDQGEITHIRNYCEIDALVTYIVYLRYAMLTGKTTKNGYNSAIEQIIAYISPNDTQPNYRANLHQFYTLWQAQTANDFYI